MTALTTDQARLLSGLLDDSKQSARAFRVTHEESRTFLDDLEQQGLLFKDEDRYTLSLLLLADLRDKRYTTADSICYFCGFLLDALYRLYRQQPGRKFGLEDLAGATESAPSKVQRALAYLTQAPVWDSVEGPAAAPVAITPNERILDFKDLPSVLTYLRDAREAQLRPPQGARERQQKFGILDSSNQLDVDLEAARGVLGRAVVFCDLDNFKALNTRFTETGVDRSILPHVHRLLADCAEGHARAYCVGGDEFAFLLSNASMGMAQAFAEEVRIEIFRLQLETAKDVQLSASVGVAHSAASENSPLRERANVAMRRAKDGGKNCVVFWTP